ncbi:hypothetical protein FJ364_02830 [Candidatus Dependentiae bacterium]|nr:hypothetical protein [Candidatus Dependentiae bacterium]
MEIKITETGKIKQLKMSAQKSYRQFEFDQLIDVTLSSSAPTCDFKIQIRSDEGSTKWLNITPSELAAIRETLTKSKATNT